MRNYIFISVFICFTFNISAQSDTISVYSSRDYFNNFDHYFKKVSFKIGGGVFLPQNELKKHFGVSPLIDLSANFPLKKGKSIELAIQFVVPDQKESFKYLRAIDTLQAKATFMFNPMIRFKKNVMASRKSKLRVGLGVGGSIIYTNARNPLYEGNEGQNKYENISSLLLSPTLEFIKKYNEDEELSFNFGFQYSPYKVEGALRQDIGSIALIPRISYKF